MKSTIEICRFLEDAPCAYSMTYDEGFVEILANAYPVHRELGIPGHVDVVAGQLGTVRNCYKSSMNGYFHMGVEHLKFLIQEGWTVGNHSWSHYVYPDQPGLDLRREIIYSKYSLEDRLGVPITYFAIPNDNYNYLPALPFIEEAGYLACQVVDGGLNEDNVHLLKVGNFMVASGPLKPRPGWPENLLTENLNRDTLDGKWLCETTHLVQEYPIQDWKNISVADLEKRFQKILDITDQRVWAAVPEDVVDYILLRRNTTLQQDSDDRFSLQVNFPVGIRQHQLSFRISDPDQLITEIRDEESALHFRRDEGHLVFTLNDLGLRTRRNNLSFQIIKDPETHS